MKCLNNIEEFNKVGPKQDNKQKILDRVLQNSENGTPKIKFRILEEGDHLSAFKNMQINLIIQKGKLIKTKPFI